MIMLRVVYRAPLARKFKMEVLIHSWTIRTARLTERLEHFIGSKLTLLLLAVFILSRHYPSGRTWTNICTSCGYASQVYRLRIIRLDRTNFPSKFVLNDALSKGISSGCMMRLVPVFILETHNQTNHYKTSVAQVRPDG